MTAPGDFPEFGEDLPLKVVAPRAPRHLVARGRLRGAAAPWRGHRLVAVEAPAGFGKTSLLGLWRRDLLAERIVTAWITAEPQDDPARFVQALALSVRHAAALPAFGHFLVETPPEGSIADVTSWLGEVAAAGVDIALIVDEAEKLPAASCELLGYVLYNAPANLRCIVGARPGLQLPIAECVAAGECARIGTEELRFRVEESIELLDERFPPGFPRDKALQLHELAEGWPLGLQLMVAGIDAGGTGVVLPTLDVRGDAVLEPFVSFMLGKLDPADLDFLTRTSFLPNLHPELVAAVLDDPSARERLARLVRDTPLFVTSEQGRWTRLHALAKDTLARRYRELPPAEAGGLQRRASRWFESKGLLELAAEHALAAGDEERTFALAERALYDSNMLRGRQRSVIEWISRLPRAQVQQRPRLALAAAWALATSEHHAEAVELVKAIRTRAPADPALQFECDLTIGGAAVFDDDPDRFAQLHDRWGDLPPVDDPALLQVHANRSAYRAMIEGQSGLARLRLRHTRRASPHLERWGTFIAGLNHLWEGQARLAIEVLRPLVAALEAEHGPRNPFTTTAAAVLAGALQLNRSDAEAGSLLANRLDVLESSGVPDAIVAGFCALTRIAHAAGRENRAFELLAALDAVGVARRLPRLRIASLYEQARLHAHGFRGESARAASAQLETIAQRHAAKGPLWVRSIAPKRAMALAYAAVAQRHWREAIEALVAAEPIIQGSQRSRFQVEMLLLRALATRAVGGEEAGLLREAVDLAKWRGLQAVLFDVHPDVIGLIRSQIGDEPLASAASRDATPAPARPNAPEASSPATPTALTAKEREVAELLARQLSNKEIARAMQVGPETVKWHLKNLFGKLHASSRKQAVARARMLGLLPEE